MNGAWWIDGPQSIQGIALGVSPISFVAPGFAAAGALLVGIPILIHILNRRRFKVVRWAAMEYLLQAMRKNRRRLKFEQLLLLIVRCLVLFLLGMALARPMMCQNGKLSAMMGGRSGLHVFVIDNGYTMGYEADRANAKTQLDQAKLMAKQYIDKLNSGSESVVLITAGRPAKAIIASPSFNLDEARDAVDRIEQGYDGSDLAGALQLATQIGRADSKQPHKSLYLFTDNTRSAWAGAQANEIKEASRQLPALFKTTVHCLGNPDQWNQAVLDISPVGNLVSTKFDMDFTTLVRGYGNGPNPLLEIKLDEKPVTGGGNEIKPDTQSPPQQQHAQRIGTGGPHVLSAVLRCEDRLKIDNTRYHVMDVASELKVLIVEGERGIKALDGSGAFLSAALMGTPLQQTDPNEKGQTDSPISPEQISDLELGNKVLTNYGAVVLTDVGEIAPAEADQIEKYVESGGTLMVFMGPRINGDTYNSVMLGTMADGRHRHLLPGRLIKTQSNMQQPNHESFTFDFNPNGVLHPLLNAFRGAIKSGLETSSVDEYWQVEPAADANVERVLDYRPIGAAAGTQPAAGSRKSDVKGDPAITVQSVGNGRVIFVSTTANNEWTSFSGKPVYVELITELLTGTISAGDSWMNLVVDQQLQVPESLGLTTAPTFMDPSKKSVGMDVVTLADGSTTYRSVKLTRPGVYTLSTGKAALPIAVNVPADAADARTIVPQGIKEAMGGIDANMLGDTIPTGSSRRDENDESSWYFMLAVLLLAALECFLAMHFGHFRRKSSAVSHEPAAA